MSSRSKRRRKKLLWKEFMKRKWGELNKKPSPSPRKPPVAPFKHSA
ncbi:hypothetical protein SHA02_01770 [Salisediminibacterium halotolerans]|nr:hypothetical protein SHA02_01770 [Salisediminibacterium halotolerans]